VGRFRLVTMASLQWVGGRRGWRSGGESAQDDGGRAVRRVVGVGGSYREGRKLVVLLWCVFELLCNGLRHTQRGWVGFQDVLFSLLVFCIYNLN
jgi:hypothetical protein